MPLWCCRYKNLLSLSLGLVGIEGAVVHSGDLHEQQSLHNLVLLLSHADGDLPRLKEADTQNVNLSLGSR